MCSLFLMMNQAPDTHSAASPSAASAYRDRDVPAFLPLSHFDADFAFSWHPLCLALMAKGMWTKLRGYQGQHDSEGKLVSKDPSSPEMWAASPARLFPQLLSPEIPVLHLTLEPQEHLGTPHFLPPPNPLLLSLSNPQNPVEIYASVKSTLDFGQLFQVVQRLKLPKHAAGCCCTCQPAGAHLGNPPRAAPGVGTAG